MGEHAPGPWRVTRTERGDVWIHDRDGNLIADVMSDAPHEPNAELLAAAPELLAACREIRRDLVGAEKLLDAMGLEQSDRGREILNLVEAAIRKAEGREG
jgi:hypothetical protein